MTRPFLTALTVMLVLVGSVCAADDKAKQDKDGARSTNVTVTNIDARKGTITVKYTDDQGKPQEKTFHLSQDVRLLDETGRVVGFVEKPKTEEQLQPIRTPVEWLHRRGIQDGGVAMKVVARFVISEHQCVAQVEIQERARRLVPGEPGFRS